MILLPILLKKMMMTISKVCLAYTVAGVFITLIVSDKLPDDDEDFIKGLFGEDRTSKRETSAVRFGMFLRSLENSHLKKKKKR